MSDKKYLESESLKEAMWKNFYKEEDKWEGMPEAEFLDAHGGCPRHWFQLGFSAGLDAVVKADLVPREMTAREYAKAKWQMCKNAYCKDCPLGVWRDQDDARNCSEWSAKHPEEAVAIVEEWAREHPEERSE